MPEVIVVSKFVNGNQRVEGDWTVEHLGKKLETVTGVPPESQVLQFTSESGRTVSPPDKHTTLAELGVQNGWQIRVSDSRPENEQLDLSGGAKYEIPLEDYEKRHNTVLQWKKDNKLGRFAETQQPSQPQNETQPAPSVPFDIPLGDECFVRLVSGKSVRGVVAFAGEVPHIAPGTWVGVRLFSPEGRNNGTVKGVHLFDALPNHGVLVKPDVVRPLNEDEEEL